MINYPKLAFLMVLSTTSCVKQDHAPEISDLVDDFEYTYGYSTDSIKIMMVYKFKDTVRVGECLTMPPTISIKIGAWNAYGPIQKKVLLFHELGHCLFGREHILDVFEDGCPKSIMYPNIMSEKCFIAHEDELILELGPRLRGMYK